VSYEKMMSAT